jgi:hypothetical protein
VRRELDEPAAEHDEALAREAAVAAERKESEARKAAIAEVVPIIHS